MHIQHLSIPFDLKGPLCRPNGYISVIPAAQHDTFRFFPIIDLVKEVAYRSPTAIRFMQREKPIIISNGKALHPSALFLQLIHIAKPPCEGVCIGQRSS